MEVIKKEMNKRGKARRAEQRKKMGLKAGEEADVTMQEGAWREGGEEGRQWEGEINEVEGRAKEEKYAEYT